MKAFLPVLLVPAVWIAKSIVYIVVFRIRKIPSTVLSCLIIGGSSLLLKMMPLQIPGFVQIPITIGLAVYLTMHYTQIKLIPNGLFIPLSVEVFFNIGVWGIQAFTTIQLMG